ncbi:alpha/beta hydrolase [Solirubrobacter sp. CPCC 204708]|uniref:Alpha/beta hydrolase n=2 Tax=Solirubrobacter deserti TaxID=2282478 RepID=A0ABT4RSQ0_9ACTN|nr:alpha/beta hydrolase [Solirubrobacter deserti]MBE2315927.1 alpha/beta hydrolase [Solirubrobacter deserti]MDA0141607.1 alpha/beta hydrolase [Solirubrobacter deserti]
MQIDVPGGHIHAVIEGEGPLVLLIHGFPEGAWAWRHQLPALAAGGYRAVAIDVRGYGDSLKPDAVEAYRMLAHVADNVAVLEALEADTAVVVGHDWGSPIAAASAQVRPDRFTAVALLGVPYQPRADTPPAFPPDFYVAHFQTDAAQREIEADIESWLRRFYAALTDGTPGWFGNPMHLPDAALPAWVDDFEAIVAAFERGGFAGPLNRYRNFVRDWEDLAAFDELRVPSIFITGERDSTRLWMPAEGHVIPDCGHWVQQERPQAVNALLEDFLRSLGQPV